MEIEETEALGRRNQEIIDLVGQHCRNARVEKSPHFGEGMIEQLTGLPIGGREVKCPHASNPSFAGMDLEQIAADFYRQNCVGCPHRDVVGIPNLKTHVEEIDAAAEGESQRRNEETAKRRVEQADRAKERAKLVAEDPRPVREWIALIDGIDSEEPDDRGKQFLDIAKGGAELCTDSAAEAIVAATLATPASQLCEALEVLNAAGRIGDEGALEAALFALGKGPNRSAVKIVERLRGRLGSEDLLPCMRSAVRLAGPQRGIPHSSVRPDTRLLAIAAETNLPALLDCIVEMLGEGPWARSSAGHAAAELIAIEPGTAEVLAGALVDAVSLPKSTSIYSDSPRRGISDGLHAALLARPRVVAAIYLRRAAGLEDDERDLVLHAFDSVIRKEMSSDAVPEPAGEVAIDSLLEIVSGDFGEKAANSAARSLKLATEYHAELLAERPAALIGALMKAISEPVTPEPDAPAALAQLMQGAEKSLRGGRVSFLTSALANLATHRPAAVAPELFALLDGEDPPGDAARELRARMTEALGSLAIHPDLRGEALQRLYRGLLAPEVLIRASAIKAWEELASAPHFTPPLELEELILPLLTDKFVMVHRAMARALRYRIVIPERLREPIVVSLLQLTGAYSQGEVDQPALAELISTAWAAAAELDAPARRGVRRLLLAQAMHLDVRNLERLVTGTKGEVLNFEEYADRLLEAVTQSDTTDNHRAEELLRRVRELPAEAIRSRAAAVLEAARARLPQWTIEAAEFVEVLQGAGLFDEGAALAEEISAGVPDDAEHAAQRSHVLGQLSHARFEVALVGADFTAASAALDEWRAQIGREAETCEARSHPLGLPLTEDTDHLSIILEARASAHAALGSAEPPPQIAAELEEACERSRAAVAEDAIGVTPRRWLAHRELLGIAVALEHWDAAIRDAEAEAERHLRSAHRRAELLRDRLLKDSEPDRAADLIGFAEMAARVSNYEEARSFRERLREVALPVPLIRSEHKGVGSPPRHSSRADQTAAPRAVVLLLVEDELIGETLRVERDRFHSVRALVRVIDWPEEQDRLKLRFTSVWDTATIEVPELSLARPSAGPEPLAVEGEVQLVLRASGEQVVDLAIAASLAGEDGQESEIAVLGQRGLAIRAFDPRLDGLTGVAVIDERLHDVVAHLKGKVPEPELEAFVRFFAAIARAARAIQVKNVFEEGTPVPESEFQDEMERRLGSDATLGGRLERTDAAGGHTDLVHDGINCELKVERDRAVNLEVARRYIGQPVQYGSGSQRQLSLLCILDMSAKDLPPGTLANNIGLLAPELHGQEDPEHPSWVGAVVIPGNLPVPSSWSGTPLPAKAEDGGS